MRWKSQESHPPRLRSSQRPGIVPLSRAKPSEARPLPQSHVYMAMPRRVRASRPSTKSPVCPDNSCATSRAAIINADGRVGGPRRRLRILKQGLTLDPSAVIQLPNAAPTQRRRAASAQKDARLSTYHCIAQLIICLSVTPPPPPGSVRGIVVGALKGNLLAQGSR